jgi:hypothetical protein
MHALGWCNPRHSNGVGPIWLCHSRLSRPDPTNDEPGQHSPVLRLGVRRVLLHGLELMEVGEFFRLRATHAFPALKHGAQRAKPAGAGYSGHFNRFRTLKRPLPTCP